MKWIQKIANEPCSWYLLPMLLVILPVLLFGVPSFYGDDLNFFIAIERFGTVGAIAHWADEYGWVYRPIGVSIEYFLYSLFRSQEILFYWFSVSTYLFFVWVLHRQLLRVSADPMLSGFVVTFFALFPLNPTAYLQLSSIYMIIAGAVSIFLIGRIVDHEDLPSRTELMLLVLLWGGVLLVYEQVTGLVAVLALLVLLVNLNQGAGIAFNRSVIVSSLFGLVTLMFLVFYVLAPNNPKIVTLKNLNQVDATEVVQSVKGKEDKSIQPVGRLQSLLARADKVVDFFSDNMSYAWRNLLASGLSGLLMLMFLLLAPLMALFLEVKAPSRRRASIYLLVGFLWFLVTFAPFLLYRAVHVPPYTLLIPSVGLGLALYGGFWLLFSGRASVLVFGGYKVLLAIMLLVFPLLQTGYYFGLREELDYWYKLAYKLEPVKEELLAGHEIRVEHVPKKNNGHIFWLEKAVGHRYLRTLLGDEFYAVEINRITGVESVRFLPESMKGNPRVLSYVTGEVFISAASVD